MRCRSCNTILEDYEIEHLTYENGESIELCMRCYGESYFETTEDYNNE